MGMITFIDGLAASIIASAAKAGWDKIIVVSAPAVSTASFNGVENRTVHEWLELGYHQQHLFRIQSIWRRQKITFTSCKSLYYYFRIFY